MTWHNTKNRSRRMAITFVPSGTNPPTLSLGPEHADFWGTVQSDGYDIVVAAADGQAMKHERLTWDYTNRTASFRIEATSPFSLPSGASIGVCYLYWKASSNVGTDPSASVASAGSVTGRALPVDWRAADTAYIVAGAPPDGSSSTPKPLDVVAVPNGGSRLVVSEVGLARLDGGGRVSGGTTLEDVAGLAVAVLDADSSGAPATPANWWSDANIRLAVTADDRVAVVVPVTPDEAVDATLRVRAYLMGPSSGSLPARVDARYALIRGLTPREA